MLGPVVVDIESVSLNARDVARIMHPQTGGIILFARNYESPDQLRALTASIRALRSPAVLIAVDHEGGRVQRFREGFTALPPMRSFGALWDIDPDAARIAAHAAGFVIGCELLDHGVDFSFAPVLDLDYGASGVIGDRAFHSDPAVVGVLAAAFHVGASDAGMSTVGKHYPGHGYVRADSHHEVPVDERPFTAIAAADLLPFRSLVEAGMAGVMPAHVVYPAFDAVPAGYSSRWLNEILRGSLGFDGLVFSDDLSMAGAGTAGTIAERAAAALGAGCDMVLLCNDGTAADQLLADLADRPIATTLAARIEAMRARREQRSADWPTQYRDARAAVLAVTA